MSILADAVHEILDYIKERYELQARYDKAIIAVGPNGSVEPEGMEGWVWIQVHGNPSSLVRAFNRATAHTAGLQVRVTRTRWRYYEVTGVAHEVGAFDDDPNPYLPQHGATHEAGRGEGQGSDIVYLYKEAWTELQPIGTNPASMQIYVAPWRYIYRGLDRLWPGGLTPELEAPHSGWWWARVYLRIEAGALEVDYSRVSDGTMEVPKPAVGADGVPVCSIKIWYDSEHITRSMIEDDRQFINIPGGLAPPAPPLAPSQEVAVMGLPGML